MRRSWIALGIVIATIVVVIIVLVRAQPRTGLRAPEAKEQPAPAPSSTPTTGTPREPAKEPDTKDVVEPPKKAPPVDPDAVLKEADEKLAAGKLAEGYKLLSDAVLREPGVKRGNELKARLAKLADEAFFSDKVIAPFAIAHQVVAGDSLEKLRKEHKTTIELLMKLNRLKDDKLRIGQRLKIIPGGFDVAVDKSDFRLTVTKDGFWVREFKVGLGKDGTTPVGQFVAGVKLPQPVYFGDGAPIPYGDKQRNPLGTRWITIEKEYGIHGTWEPESMGKEGSKGCVRMLNQDVEWLYDLIVPGNSKIVIRP